MKYSFLLLTLFIASASARPWTNNAGKTIEAEFGGIEGDNVVLLLKKKTYKVPLSSLSEQDQQYAKEQVALAAKAKQEAAEKIRTQGYPFGDTHIKPGELKTTTLPLSEANQSLALKGGKGWKESWINNYRGQWLKDMAKGYPISETNTLIGLPPAFDPSQPTTIFIQWASGDSKNNIRGAKAYWNSCKENNWILLSIDSTPDSKSAWSFSAFLASINTALDALHSQWPNAKQWPIVCGGFSGGAKNSQIMAGLLSQYDHNVKGLFMGGCNETFFELGTQDYNIKKATWRKLKAFESSGTKDHLVDKAWRAKVRKGLKDASLKDFKTKTYDGGHSLHHGQFVEAVKWILTEDS
ncbi:hypothetical protein [Rubritalea tangerina]|uniref:SLA1 homology domain-containing protein n=1 Tax=Rubritalea tangerina TaxID=430798 RepID=A0ABW4Z942_9BACT